MRLDHVLFAEGQGHEAERAAGFADLAVRGGSNIVTNLSASLLCSQAAQLDQVCTLPLLGEWLDFVLMSGWVVLLKKDMLIQAVRRVPFPR
jgi:hypothetical protein